MRIHRLTFQAIGPFPGRHTIDLDRLSAGGLFLLEGPTGAGKSTIIDAVVLALYGSVAGTEASAERLHSHHAAPGVEPFVDMVFSTGSGIYRVWRSPRFERPKQRGSGTTTQNPRARLWRLSSVEDEAGEPVSAHVQEVTTELGRVVVLDRTQFTQTVVLPQGQFASFLRARPEDRRALLQEVFGTEVYERLQDRLVTMARDARESIAAARAEVAEAASVFGEAAGVGEGDPARPLLRDATDPGRPRAAAAVVLTGLRERADTARVAEQVAEAAELSAREALDAERDLAARLARRSRLLTTRTALAGRAGEIDAAEARWRSAHRAASVRPAVQAVQEAAHRRDATAEHLAWARAQAAQHPAVTAVLADPGRPGTADVDALRALLETYAGRCQGLRELAAVERGLPGRRAELATEGAALTVLAGEVDAATADLAARPVEARRLADAHVAASAEAATLEDAQQAEEAAAARLRAAERATEQEGRVRAAEQAVAEARAAAVAAVDDERAVRVRWIEGIAGEIAAGLVAGAPCPVCGSATHPAPARAEPDHPGQEDVERAAGDRERAQQVLEAARLELVTAHGQLDVARQGADGRDGAAARTELERARARREAAARAREDAARLAAELRDHEAGTERLTAALTDRRAELTTRRERLAQATARLEEDGARCARAAGAHATVTEELDRLEVVRDAARSLLEALEAHAVAQRDLREAQARREEALGLAGFADPAAAEAALLGPEEVEALERETRAYRAEVAAVDSSLREPGLAALTGTEPVDVVAAEAAHAAAQARCTAATRVAAEAASRAGRAARAADRLHRCLRRHEERVRDSGPVVRMADLAAAREGSDITLATFVLLQRFEDVVAAANERLTAMSDGRYELRRVDEEGGQRSRKAGLGLEVLDHVTEAPRDPRTLSGGETFYVSLCLALGLADVVTAEAGGVELGTLFVDEGFGSLDPETLDTVMAELGRLHRGGRAVGIVSHVADLKSRIAERVEVRRTAAGGSTLTVRA